MSSTPPLALSSARPSWLEVARGCVEMTKARLSSLVLLTTAVGFVLAAVGPLDLTLLAWTCLGTALSAFGANALNQCLERPRDSRMTRTCGRPLPSGRVSPVQGLVWGLSLVGGGTALLVATVNPLAGFLALWVAVLYVTLYTPLKPRTSLNTLVGAVCGAVPPMIGWVAVTERLDAGAWILFAILFAWQIPHFLAIDWFHREDYAEGGFWMISRVDPSGSFGARMAVLYCLALLPISILAAAFGLGGWLYLIGAIVLGMAFLGLSLLLFVTRTRRAARGLFFGSLAYLPLLLLLLVFDPTV